MTRTTQLITSLLAILVLGSVASAQAPGLRLRECLYLPPCPNVDGDGFLDAVDQAVAMGTITAPSVGDTVTCTNGQKALWRTVTLEEPGITFDVDPGSWMYFSVDDLPAGPALVDLMGHQAFYVNGLPRSGRPTSIGQMKYPVQLKEGVNGFLVQAAEGPVAFKISELGPDEPNVRILQYDRVLPWLLDLHHVDIVASLLVVNAGDEPLEDVRIATRTRFKPLTEFADYPSDAVPGVWEYTAVDVVPAVSIAKVPFRIVGPPPHKRTGKPYPVDIELQRASDGEAIASAVINFSARKLNNHFKRTWMDNLGTVQECIILASEQEQGESKDVPVLVSIPSLLKNPMTTAYAFEEDTKATVLVPTTRRMGLGGTAMGQAHVVEALELVDTLHGIDRERIAVNGYADSAVDAWELALRHPGVFKGVAVIGTNIPLRDETPLWDNADGLDVIYRHGRGDSTIRAGMAEAFEADRESTSGRTRIDIPPDFDRWWGAMTIADEEMDEFLLVEGDGRSDLLSIDLVQDQLTQPHPDHWAVIHQWEDASMPGRLQANIVGGQAVIKTANVRELLLRGEPINSTGPLKIEIDGVALSLDSDSDEVCLQRDADGWHVADGCNVTGKTRLRSCFQHLFRRPLLLVYGTGGDEMATRECWAKARFDAEQFWNLADGPARVVADSAVTDDMLNGRNVILYGNADTNTTWARLLDGSPVNVRTGSVTIGERQLDGEDLVMVFVQPLAGDREGLVAAVGTSGPRARRIAWRLPTTDPAQELPDWMVVDSSSMATGVRDSGRFNRHWAPVSRP